MAIDLDLDANRAEALLKQAGLDFVRDSAAVMQETAQANARVDTGNMRRMIVLIPTSDGANVEARSGVSLFHEFGTGIYNERGGGRSDEWVYFDERRQQFFTTRGVTPQPFMRPGYAAGVDFFHSEARRRGLK